jgi:hypothetical protein
MRLETASAKGISIGLLGCAWHCGRYSGQPPNTATIPKGVRTFQKRRGGREEEGKGRGGEGRGGEEKRGGRKFAFYSYSRIMEDESNL